MPFVEGTRIGQYVTVDPGAHPDLANQRFLITEVIGTGDDAMLAMRGDRGLLTGLGGRMVRYIRADETRPAAARAGERSRVVEVEKEPVQMSATQNIINLANQLGGKREHYIEAGRRLKTDVTAYQKQFGSRAGSDPDEMSSPRAVTSLNANEIRTEIQQWHARKAARMTRRPM